MKIPHENQNIRFGKYDKELLILVRTIAYNEDESISRTMINLLKDYFEKVDPIMDKYNLDDLLEVVAGHMGEN